MTGHRDSAPHPYNADALIAASGFTARSGDDGGAAAFARHGRAETSDSHNESRAHDHGIDKTRTATIDNVATQAASITDGADATAGPAHRHATSSAHIHARGLRGVVTVDAGGDPKAPQAAAGGFDGYWSIVPSRTQIVLRRLSAAPPRHASGARTAWPVGPPERPPRA